MPKNNSEISKKLLFDNISKVAKNITEFILKNLEQIGKGLESLGNQSETFNKDRIRSSEN